MLCLKVKVKFTLLPIDSRPVCPGVRPPIYISFHTNYLQAFVLFSMGSLSDERTGLAFVSAVTLGSKSGRTRDHILLSHLRWRSLLSPPTTRRATMEVNSVRVKVKVILPPTFSRTVSHGIRPPSENRDQFFFIFQENYHKIFVFLLWGVLSDERTGL
jgi:hypothetical protein